MIVRKVYNLTLSQCCKKSIYSLINTMSKGFFCTKCENEVFSTIDKKTYQKSIKKNEKNN